MSSPEYNPILQRAILSAKTRKLADETLPSLQKKRQIALIIGLTFGFMGLSITASHHINIETHKQSDLIKSDPFPKPGFYLSCGQKENVLKETPLCGTRSMGEYPIPGMSEYTINKSPNTLFEYSTSHKFNQNIDDKKETSKYDYTAIAPFPEGFLDSKKNKPNITDAKLIQFLRNIGNRIGYFSDPSASDADKDVIIVNDILPSSEKTLDGSAKDNSPQKLQSFLAIGDDRQTLSQKIKRATLIFDRTSWESSHGYFIFPENSEKNSEKLLGDIYKSNSLQDEKISQADLDTIENTIAYPALRTSSASLTAEKFNIGHNKTMLTIKQGMKFNQLIDEKNTTPHTKKKNINHHHEIEDTFYGIFAILLAFSLYLQTNALMITRSINRFAKSK